MAHPWVFESTFENTTTPFGWDTETDTGTKLDVPRYYDMARLPGLAMPYRGASCLRIDLRSGDTNDHTLTEGDIDIADAATRYFRFYLWLSTDFAATADDVFNLFELQQAGGTVECSLGCRITALTGAVEIGIGDGTATTNYATSTLQKGVWTAIEWAVKISTGGVGTQDLYVDGSPSVVSLTTLTNAAAVGQGVLGTQDQLSTTTGTILIDEFCMDDARVYPFNLRFPMNRVVTTAEHVFVGPGSIESAAVLTTGASDGVVLYDTDTGNTNDASNIVVELNNAASGSATGGGPMGDIFFQRGCYAVPSANARAQVTLARQRGPTYSTENGVRRYGLRRNERVLNV